MSIVMRIAPEESVAVRALGALHDLDRDGRLPLQWTFGRDVWNRLRSASVDYSDPLALDSFYGLPFVVKGNAPPDLLELDSF